MFAEGEGYLSPGPSALDFFSTITAVTGTPTGLVGEARQLRGFSGPWPLVWEIKQIWREKEIFQG